MADKRKYSRKIKHIKSEVHSDEGMTFSNTVDISSGGIFISTPEPPGEGTEIMLSLQLPGEEPVDIKGIVKWVRSDENGENKAGMGIEFTDASEKEISKVKKLLHEA